MGCSASKEKLDRFVVKGAHCVERPRGTARYHKDHGISSLKVLVHSKKGLKGLSVQGAVSLRCSQCGTQAPPFMLKSV